VEVEILDLNDNAPEFEVEFYNISIVENLPSGFSVLQVNAIDRDQGENAEFYYNLAEEDPAGAFLIDSRTGWITVRDHTMLDRESRSSISMIVKAVERITPYDKDRAKDSGKVQVEITLLDSNDNTPQFENGNLYEFKVNVNSVVGTMVGKRTWYSFDLQEGEYFDQSLDQLEAFDEDYGQNANITYEIKDGENVPFKISPKSGVLKANGNLDRETKSQYEFVVIATDNGQTKRLSGSVEVEVNVLDVNDNAPEFIGYDDLQIKAEETNERLDMVGRKMLTDENLNKIETIKKLPVYKAYLDRSTIPGTFVRQITAIDKDYAGNGNGLVMYSLLHHKLPHSFEIDSRDDFVKPIAIQKCNFNVECRIQECAEC
uniref:Cadherin domain-containing protein n=1 Tax=Megaselia scalaris TaxID=36166 RepID=T1GU95_MEGSC